MIRTETIDYLYSATWAARLSQIQDNIFKAHVLWAWLTSKGRMKTVVGGRFIEERLLYGKNTTFQSVGKGGTVSINPLDGRVVSRWSWKNVIGSLVRYRDDAFQNRGPSQIASLVDEDIQIAENSAADKLNTMCFGDGTGNSGNDFDGLQNIVADDPTASGSYATVGGISVSGNTWWENQYKDMSGLPFENYGITWMRTMFNRCADGNEKPDLILTSQTLHEAYEDLIGALQMVVPTGADRSALADLGFETLYFKKVPVVYDKNAPWTDKMYMLNSNTLRVIRSDIQWFELTDWHDIPAQPKDRAAYIIITGNLVCNNRRRNGVLFNLS